MTAADEEFQSALGEKIDELVALSVYAYSGDDRVAQAYIFVGLEDSGVYAPYFKVCDTICSLNSLDEHLGQPERPMAEQAAIQLAGQALAREMLQVFVDDDRETPYEVRIVHDCAAGSVDFAFYYNQPQVKGSTLTTSLLWLKSLQAGENPLPPDD